MQQAFEHQLAVDWSCVQQASEPFIVCRCNMSLHMTQVESALGTAENAAKVQVLGKGWGMCSKRCHINFWLISTSRLAGCNTHLRVASAAGSHVVGRQA